MRLNLFIIWFNSFFRYWWEFDSSFCLIWPCDSWRPSRRGLMRSSSWGVRPQGSCRAKCSDSPKRPPWRTRKYRELGRSSCCCAHAPCLTCIDAERATITVRRSWRDRASRACRSTRRLGRTRLPNRRTLLS